jgi:hypothetical protein
MVVGFQRLRSPYGGLRGREMRPFFLRCGAQKRVTDSHTPGGWTRVCVPPFSLRAVEGVFIRISKVG